MVRTEPGNFRIHPMAAFTTLSTSRVEPNLGSIRAQANHGPSPTLKHDEGLIGHSPASAFPNGGLSVGKDALDVPVQGLKSFRE